MMRMRMLGMTAILCGTMLVFAGCSKKAMENGNQNSAITENAETDENAGDSEAVKEPDASKEAVMLTYSFLYDDATRTEVSEIMKANGVDEDTIHKFMAIVTQFTETLGEMQGAHEGYVTVDATQPFYDFEYMGMTLDKKLGFDDQNCRLTAYSLFHSFFEAASDSGFVYEDDSLYGDIEILKGNENLSFSDEDMRKYTTLFAEVSTENTMDIKVHAEAMKRTWEERGITFMNEDQVQLASIISHDPVRNILYAGHAGVVFQTDEGYLLIEKLSQYTPFVAARFETYEQMNAYLLSEVEGFQQDGAAESFIMLNDQLILEK